MAPMAAILLAAPPVFAIASLAMPAGAGGGILYVPLMQVMGVADTSNVAAALAQPMIFGAALAAVSYNLAWQWRHPEEHIVDPDIVLATVPLCLAGTMVGTLLNRMLPEVVISAALFLVLANTIRTTFIKARKLWRDETAAMGAARSPTTSSEAIGRPSPDPRPAPLSEVSPTAEASPLNRVDTPHSTFSLYLGPEPEPDGLRRRHPAATLEDGAVRPEAEAAGRHAAAVAPAVDLPEVVDAVRQAAGAAPSPAGKRLAVRAWSSLLVVWGVLALSLLLRAGSFGVVPAAAASAGPCSWEFWCITAVAFIFLVAVALRTRVDCVSPSACFFVGTLSSCVGLGGGVVLIPMLLGRGVDPTLSVATVTWNTVIMSSSASLSFLKAGAMPMAPALVLSASTFLGSMCGKSVVGWLVSKTGRSSFLVFVLTGFMVVSACLTLVEGALTAWDGFAAGDNPLLEFQGLCQT